MKWIAPPRKDDDNGTLEKRLWDAADQLRANSGLTAQQYSQPVLGLIFLRFAEVRYDRLFQHGYEVADATLHAYGHAAFNPT
jgi:type I restriction enzyme M protein